MAEQDTYDPSMECVSCASCTTNGLAPAVRVLHEKHPRGKVKEKPQISGPDVVVSVFKSMYRVYIEVHCFDK